MDIFSQSVPIVMLPVYDRIPYLTKIIIHIEKECLPNEKDLSAEQSEKKEKIRVS